MSRPLPDVSYGEAGKAAPKATPQELDDEIDENELEETPQDVIDILGFDPADEEDTDNGRTEE